MGLEQKMSFVKPPVVAALRTNTRILLETCRGFGSKALLSDASFFFFAFVFILFYYFLFFYFFIVVGFVIH